MELNCVEPPDSGAVVVAFVTAMGAVDAAHVAVDEEEKAEEEEDDDDWESGAACTREPAAETQRARARKGRMAAVATEKKKKRERERESANKSEREPVEALCLQRVSRPAALWPEAHTAPPRSPRCPSCASLGRRKEGTARPTAA